MPRDYRDALGATPPDHAPKPDDEPITVTLSLRQWRRIWHLLPGGLFLALAGYSDLYIHAVDRMRVSLRNQVPGIEGHS